MLRSLASFVLLVAAVAANASAAGLAEDNPASADVARCAAAPPCGYIQPSMSIKLDNPVCVPGYTGVADLSSCPALLADGASVTYAGTVRWYWKLSEDGTYPADANEPIDITLGATQSTVPWLRIDVEPSTFTITQVDLLDPRYLVVDDSSGSQVVYYSFERPIAVTVTRQGSPDTANDDPFDPASAAYARDRIQSSGGILTAFARAFATPSGAWFREAFATRIIGFDATGLFDATGQPVANPVPTPFGTPTTTEAPEESAPGPAAAMLALSLVGAAYARRRAARSR